MGRLQHILHGDERLFVFSIRSQVDDFRVDKRFLQECLAKGMSLEAIGRQVGRHPSTIGYWLRQHGLIANGRARHAPKGDVDPARLRVLVEEGTTLRKIAEEFGAGCSTIRYWLKQLGLETDRSVRTKQAREARRRGLKRAYLRCPKHGHTAFFSRTDGAFRCSRCNSEAVARRRRKVKTILVKEAGGCCALCGFAEHPAALQFHHLDPAGKEFHLSQRGFTRSIARARAEAAKCVLLCANCHALVEAGVRNVPDPVSLE